MKVLTPQLLASAQPVLRSPIYWRCRSQSFVLERESQIYDLPQAVHFDDEIMRVFQNIGIADELLPLVRVTRHEVC